MLSTVSGRPEILNRRESTLKMARMHARASKANNKTTPETLCVALIIAHLFICELLLQDSTQQGSGWLLEPLLQCWQHRLQAFSISYSFNAFEKRLYSSLIMVRHDSVFCFGHFGSGTSNKRVLRLDATCNLYGFTTQER